MNHYLKELKPLIEIGLEDVQKAFGIKESLWECVERELMPNESLYSVCKHRDVEDWREHFALGGPGTILNAVVIYCLLRHYHIFSVIETGVSGGFYTSFILEAIHKNGGIVTSIELSDDLKEVGKLVPQKFKNSVFWNLVTGQDSISFLTNPDNKELARTAQFYCHDSLHTMSHMLKELNEFKKCNEKEFFIFIDDQNSDNFWHKCLQTNAFRKPNNWVVNNISGNESRLSGHLGGFIKYNKSGILR